MAEELKMDKMSLNEVSGALRSAAKQYKIFKKGVEAADYLANFENVINCLKADKTQIENEIEVLEISNLQTQIVQDNLLKEKKLKIEALKNDVEEINKRARRQHEDSKKEAEKMVESIKFKVASVQAELNVLENTRTILHSKNQELKDYHDKLLKSIETLKNQFN